MMKSKSITVIFLYIVPILLFAQSGHIPNSGKSANKKIKIKWVSDLPGDFSFTEKWDYSEYIFTNKFGQLVCDGMCPEEIEGMRDETGRIRPDSMDDYYQYVDTSHYYHTIQFDKWSYPDSLWYIYNHYSDFESDTILCRTELGVSTYSTLKFYLTGNHCIPMIELYSPDPDENQTFLFINGNITIDKKLFLQDTLKAIFDFQFYDHELFSWKGKIYAPITPPPPPPSLDYTGVWDQKCYHNGKLKASARKKIYPFNVAKEVKIISFPSKYGTTPIENDTIKKSLVIDDITLTKKQIDSLTDVLFNYNYTLSRFHIIEETHSCYYPRHAIVFLDKSGHVISFTELCLECEEVKIKPSGTSMGVFCEGKYALIKDLLISVGITHFEDNPHEDLDIKELIENKIVP